METRVEITTPDGKERKRKELDKETEWLAEEVKRGAREVVQGSPRQGAEVYKDDPQ